MERRAPPRPDFRVLLELFDVRAWLDSRGVDYRVGPDRDLSAGWIGIACPFCGDELYHLGIEVGTGAANCWKCGGKNLVKVVQEIQGGTWGKALDAIREFQTFRVEEEHREESVSRIICESFNRLADPVSPRQIPLPVRQFLESRSLPPEETCRRWDLRWGGLVGPYKWRLIIPCVEEGRVVAFTGRDVSGRAGNPYKASPTQGGNTIKNHLYNIDSVQPGGTVVVVEGPTDVWKLGTGAVATFGVQWTPEQVEVLHKKRPGRVFILFDNEDLAQKQARKMSWSIWFAPVELVRLNHVKDPGSLTLEEGEQLMNELWER